MDAETSRYPIDSRAAKGMPQHCADGAESRENAHRRHRRHCRRDIRIAQHVILARMQQVGDVAAPDFDDLPPASTGSRSYLGTAFLELRRAGLIRTVGGPVAVTAGGRHSNYLHCWRLIADTGKVAAWIAAHPIPGDEDVEADGCADCPRNAPTPAGPPTRQASGFNSTCANP